MVSPSAPAGPAQAVEDARRAVETALLGRVKAGFAVSGPIASPAMKSRKPSSCPGGGKANLPETYTTL